MCCICRLANLANQNIMTQIALLPHAVAKYMLHTCEITHPPAPGRVSGSLRYGQKKGPRWHRCNEVKKTNQKNADVSTFASSSESRFFTAVRLFGKRSRTPTRVPPKAPCCDASFQPASSIKCFSFICSASLPFVRRCVVTSSVLILTSSPPQTL